MDGLSAALCGMVLIIFGFSCAALALLNPAAMRQAAPARQPEQARAVTRHQSRAVRVTFRRDTPWCDAGTVLTGTLTVLGDGRRILQPINESETTYELPSDDNQIIIEDLDSPAELL